jgi:hypothetical protein
VKLKALVGEAVLASAYFDGNLSGLQVVFEAKTKKKWDDYTKALETDQYTVADAMV